MAKFSPIKDLIDSAIALDVANPNLAISDKETLLKEAAIKLGTLDYYRMFPLRATMCTAYSSTAESMSTFNWSSMVKPQMEDGFTGNINNFNVIYLLSGGGPTYVGDTAGQTDLLVTWLYKLTIEKQYYNIGAVIGIMTFIVLSITALVTYRNSASYKNEEAFM